jgi:acetyltransferase
MQALMKTARSRGLQTLEGEVLRQNMPMKGLMAKLGFTIEHLPDDEDIVRVFKRL